MSGCSECNKHRSLRSLEEIAGIAAPAKRHERRVERLVQNYGVLGVLRLLAVHFERLYANGRMEEHQLVWNLIANFERVVVSRLAKANPQAAKAAVDRARTTLSEVGIELLSDAADVKQDDGERAVEN
jgi:hypothetical protein